MKRSEKKTRIEILYNEISHKIDKENGVSIYSKNMALFAGIGFVTSLAAFSQIAPHNQFAYVALSTMLTAGGAIVGMIKSMVSERSQINNVMNQCIRDIATREDLMPVEKVVLERYLTKETVKIKDVVKDNIISTNLDMTALENISSDRIASNLKRENSKFSEGAILENVKYRPEYVREVQKNYMQDTESGLIARMERVASLQEEKPATQISRKRLSM